MKKLSALLLALSLVCCSCGQDNPADDVLETNAEISTEEVTSEPETEKNEVSDFVGKWQGVKIIEDDEESDVFRNMPVWAIYQIELCEDGSIIFGETTSEIVGNENSWRWNRTENSTEIEFFDSENTDDINILTFDGNYLVYEESGEILYLEKVDEFTPYNPEETIDFVGKWQGVKLIEDGEESDELFDMPMWAVFQFELCEDGSIIFGETTSEIVGNENSWRWNRTENSTEIEFFDSEDDYDIDILTINGNYLVYEESGDILYLEKVDEFTPYNPEEATTENVTHEYIDADPTVFLGKWETRKLTVNSDKQYLMGEPLMNVCQLEIYDDHTAVISGAEIVGSEKFLVCECGMVSETELELLDVNGKNLLFTLDGDYLVCNVDSIVVSLGRVDEFTPKQPKEKITENITHEYIEITDPAILYGKWQGEYMIDENGDKIISDAMPMIYQFDFHEDGTLSFGEVLSEAYDAGDYTWEVTDSYTVATHYVYSTEDTDEDETIYFDGEHLIYSEGEYNDVYLEKVDEFIPVDFEEFYGLD